MIKHCEDCTFSVIDMDQLRCKNEILVTRCPSALSFRASYNRTVGCYAERADTSWFAKCGLKGKLWIKKIAATN